jgi:hypothetical protein
MITMKLGGGLCHMQNEDEPENTRGVSSLEPRNLHPPPLLPDIIAFPFTPISLIYSTPLMHHDWNRIPKKEEEKKSFFGHANFGHNMVWSPFPIR